MFRNDPSAAVAARTALVIAGCMLLAGCTSLENFTECETDSACKSKYGSLSVCADDGICEQMTRDMLQAPCDRTYGNFGAEDVVPVGVLLPSSGALGGVGTPVRQAIYLATDDINAMGGLNGREMALVVCDSAGDRDVARQAATYLIEDLGVEAILGPLTATSAFALADLAKQHEVPMISPSITDPNLSDIDDGGYIWRTVATDDKQGEALAKLVQHIMDTVLDKPHEDVRVAMVVNDDIYGETLNRAFTQHMIASGYLDFNPNPGGPDQVVSISYENAVNIDRTVPTDLEMFKELESLSPAPDIVVWLGRPDLWVTMLSYDQLMRSPTIGHTAYHVMPDLAKDIARAEMGSEEVAGRIWGTALKTNADASYPPFQSFRTIYQDAWVYDPVQVQYASNGWDATYALAIAAKNTDLSGEQINKGLERLTADGTEVEAVKSDLQKAYNAVSNGQSVALQGASGPIAFDPQTGDIESDRDIILWCYAHHTLTEVGSIFDGETFTARSCIEAAAE
ncbi:ABC transporter substrate-binding protein [Persicimonas caeni]|uniref:ABC transporter substrate-binding protein n=1 Tax=Persicimonas caeni TaxID=2292766 RepID=A0A4Y6PUJ9_PERCE|nr:ABC transporter substrate-binding protein [Persicimonas caeni]QDG52016.1 ABC transporter substrate-binding protein [Persicimonas caeni]QED33237.1 ABC transporter substrate-binding protein [Persicimonas caeni]